MTFEKVGTGTAYPNAKSTPNNKAPEFTGSVEVKGEKMQIALWRQNYDGKESFSIQFTTTAHKVEQGNRRVDVQRNVSESTQG